MNEYNLDSFLSSLFEWIEGFVVPGNSGLFSVKRNSKKVTLYGLTDMVFNLTIPKKLQAYLYTHSELDLDHWINAIQSFQDPKTGWFRERGFNFGFHFKEHSTAFAIAALKLLNAEPNFELRYKSKLITKRKVRNWLRRAPEWGLLFWPGSHRGGGLGAIFATLGEDSYPNENFFNWYFDWLDEHADPGVGFWRIGWNHKLKKRITKHELGGSIHYYWIYNFLKRPIPYPERVIDSTLSLQNELGLWDKDVSYCIDLDAVFALLRSLGQTNRYRKNDIENAIIKYLDYTITTLNDKKFLFRCYDNTHRLTGCLEAIAEIQKYMPHLFNLKAQWIDTLDISPWI
jgi:hypothetical protein